MTARALLASQYKLANRLVVLGYVLFFLGCFVHSIVMATGLLLVVGGFAFVWLGIRCPICSGRVGFALGGLASAFRSKRLLRYCPCCAWPLDDEITQSDTEPLRGANRRQP